MDKDEGACVSYGLDGLPWTQRRHRPSTQAVDVDTSPCVQFNLFWVECHSFAE